jgi:peroxiredoxin
MLRFLPLTFLFLFVISLPISAQTVIRGNASDFAGQTLIFNTYANEISNKEHPVATVHVQKNGDFEFRPEIKQTTFLFCHAGIFFMYLYAETGKEYEVKLPKRVDKKQADKVNPFFEEVRVHLTVTSGGLSHTDSTQNSQELNAQIHAFDSYFDPYYSSYAMKMYAKQSTIGLDSTLQKIESIFSQSQNPYFKAYYTYRMGLFKFMSTQFKSRSISDTYFLNKPILYDNPAYMELFNKIYEKYFVYFGRTKTGKVIYDDINTFKSLSRLKATLSQDKVLSNDTLQEMVILKGIHDGFYEMEFSRQAMLRILDSLVMTTPIAEHKVIGNDIRYKVTRLLPGYTPPPFKLLNQDSVWTSLDNFKGSFVYLIFCTTQNYACFKEFEILNKLLQKHDNLMKVVVISADEYLKDISFFAKKSPYKWTFLHYASQPEIFKEYDIRTIPTCYLIDTEGKMAISPAPLPSENLEGYLFNYLRAKKVL